MLAELRALQEAYTDAELVSVGCCRICRADDGRVFKIAAELRVRRLPHEGCTKGLCGCEWWLAMPLPKKRRRGARRPPANVTGVDPLTPGTPGMHKGAGPERGGAEYSGSIVVRRGI